MAKKKIVELKVCQVVTDGQDGSYNVTFYKDEETAKRIIAGESEEEVDEIDWDDEYQNGYFNTNKTLKFELDGDQLKLIGDELNVGSFGQ